MTVPTPGVLRIADRPAPNIGTDVFIAPGAVVVGDVTIGAGSTVWYNAVLRADYNTSSVIIGHRSNLQDSVTVHVDSQASTVVGDGVSVGHNAVVHGCTIGNNCMVGIGRKPDNG